MTGYRIDPNRRRAPAETERKPARKGMRRVSKKRAKLMREIKPLRKDFLANTEVCMVCRSAAPVDVHEIASGYAREKCLVQTSLLMSVCRECHEKVQHSPPAEQLALRELWDIDYRVSLYCELMGRNLVERDDVISRLMFRNLKEPKRR